MFHWRKLSTCDLCWNCLGMRQSWHPRLASSQTAGTSLRVSFRTLHKKGSEDTSRYISIVFWSFGPFGMKTWGSHNEPSRLRSLNPLHGSGTAPYVAGICRFSRHSGEHVLSPPKIWAQNIEILAYLPILAYLSMFWWLHQKDRVQIYQNISCFKLNIYLFI